MQYNLFSDDDFRQTTPFTDRVVCLTGSFGTGNSLIRKRILELGAVDVKASPSRTVHYVIMGNDVPEAQLSALYELNFHGYCPKVLHKAELDDIFAGHYAAYNTPAEIRKSLTLSMQHYDRLKVTLPEGKNSLYTKELYVPAETRMSQSELYQQLGNLGIYANNYIDDTTNLLLLPDSSLCHLQEGTTDETIRYIQNSYNAMCSQNFTFQMISESDLITWIKSLGSSIS
ncbi:MAG: hypothetical protein J6W52_01075 [Bacteroidaceae bacterium]|nr:hypothetical protein [Bacteroidaceae bacterium]